MASDPGMYHIPPSDFFFTCFLTNKSSNFLLLAEVLQNTSDSSGNEDASGGKQYFPCNSMPDFQSEENISCCLWDHLHTNLSHQMGFAGLRKTVLPGFVSDVKLKDFTWKVQCLFEEKVSLLICDLQTLPETNTITTDYQVNLHYTLFSKRELRGTAGCKCFGYERCECVVPSVTLNDSCVLWIEILNAMKTLQSPFMSVTPSHIGKPDPPAELKAEITEHGKLKVFWSKPSSVHYELQYQVRCYWKSAETNSEVYLFVKENSVIIGDVQPCTELSVEIRCKKLHGSAIWSNWSEAWAMNTQDVFYFPQKSLVSSGSNVSVYCMFCDKEKKVPSKNITWWINFGKMIPEDHYTPINKYISKVSLIDLKTTKPKGKFRYDPLHCCINHNECHHRYAEIYVLDLNIRISCETDGNQKTMICRWSLKNITLPEGITPQLKYYRVSAEVKESSGHLYVTWKRPTLPSTDLQFQLRYCVKKQGSLWKDLVISEEESVDIKVSDPCALYTVQVRSRRMDGAGYWSDWSTPVHTVGRDIRAPLQGPAFWGIAQNYPMHKGDSVSLLWQPLQPHHSLCTVNGYEVIHHNAKNATWSKYVGNATKYTFILSEDSVKVTVLAINSLGYSSKNSNLTFSCEMSTVNTVKSLNVYYINSTCALAVWAVLPTSYITLKFIFEWKNLGNIEQMRWINIPRNVSRFYIEDTFFPIEKYLFSLYPVFAEGIGSPKVIEGFTKLHLTEARKDNGLYVVLPIIGFSALLLMGTILLSHQRMKQIFWKDVPNPKHCSWAQGVNFEKPDTLENIFLKHNTHLATGSHLFLEPEAIFEDVKIDTEGQNEGFDKILTDDGLFILTEETDHDSACSSSHFSSGCASEVDHQEMVYSSICQSSIKYATIINNTQQCRQYNTERKTSVSSFDGCLLGNSSIVIGSHGMEKEAFLLLGLTEQANAMSSVSTVSSEGFSESLDHDENFTDGLEKNLYYLEFGSVEQCEQQNFFPEKNLVTYPFQENISYKEIELKIINSSEFIDSSHDIKSSFKKALLCYMPQFQTHFSKLPGEKESEIFHSCT
ncbi:hypothetical protein GDO86_007996 [Hymenochirus boettgeri]|uniref:Leptin receptor n=1 Tax=Hymenochirus boettgeri TaxID=247094 RepID=A0A8T2J373_9PIPI|nr:hypothetical protein GDO86_007996 [Hymenochirus boettgeri]